MKWLVKFLQFVALVCVPSLLLGAGPPWYDPNGLGNAPDWRYRVPITVTASTSVGSTVKLDADFAALLAQLGVAGTFDANSPRIVRPGGTLATTQEYTDRVYAGATDAAGNSRGEIRFIAEDAGPATYYLYFDIIQNGAKPTNPQASINGNFEVGGTGTAAPAGWITPVKSNAALDASVRPSETVNVTASPAAADGVQTRATNGTPNTGGFSYLIGNRSAAGGGVAGAPGVTFARDIAVPAAAAGNLTFRYRPEGWDAAAFDQVRIDLLSAAGAVLTELVGPTAGNYATRPWAPNAGNGAASNAAPGFSQYNGFDCTLAGVHTLGMTVGCRTEPWFTVTQSLAAYAGQTIRLRIRFSSDAADKSWVHLDDVEWSVVSGALGVPEVLGAGISVAKTSNVLDDPVNGSTNAKAIPGARVRYCVLVTNDGPADAVLVSLADLMPGNVTFQPGSIRSGVSCAASAIEDDDQVGADETDPIGASYAGVSVNANIATLASGSVLAIVFDAIVQ
jgi:uncharacterized repeat protein (TIGR01451 family)